MAKYQIDVNERTAAGKGIIAMLRAMPDDAVVVKKLRTPRRSKIYYDLRQAFHEVKDMLDGKAPMQTLDDFLEELRQEELQQELQQKQQNELYDRTVCALQA